MVASVEQRDRRRLKSLSLACRAFLDAHLIKSIHIYIYIYIYEGNIYGGPYGYPGTYTLTVYMGYMAFYQRYVVTIAYFLKAYDLRNVLQPFVSSWDMFEVL